MVAQGASFEDVSKCDLFEGSIIRAVRRVSELMNQLELAAKVYVVPPSNVYAFVRSAQEPL